MRAAAASCDGACCLDARGRRRDSAVHRPWKGQHFVTEPKQVIERWKASGYAVIEVEPAK